MTISLLILYALAVYRITQMLIVDEGPFDVFIRFRVMLLKNAGRNSLVDTLAKLFSCQYCMGIWVAILTIFLPQIIVIFFALAGLQSILVSLIDNR